MSEQYKPQETEKKQDRLREKLLSGELSTKTFLDNIFEFDQSSASRTDAEANIMLLKDPDVKRLLEADKDAKDEYFNLLSLSYFHVGQRLMTSDPSAAIMEFEASHSAAEQIQDEAYSDWKMYIEATIAYAREDIDALEIAYTSLEEGTNKEIVGSLLQGLKKRGKIDYHQDYRRTITENN